jgi:hypothetical protein
MSSEKELYILDWIEEVSKVREELYGFSICPFAKNSKFKIIECSVEDIAPIAEYQVTIFIIEDYLDLDAVQFWVKFYNSKYKNWKFFEDCSRYDTYIKGIKTNNSKYNLILSQPKEELKKFRENLAKTSYYDMWEDEYLKEILEDDYSIIENGIETP